MTTQALDVSPPYVFSERELESQRAPRRLIESPAWFADLPGPSYSRIKVKETDNNLLTQGEGEPVGSRILVSGYLLDSEGSAIPHALLELWQVNAAGRYRDPTDPGFFPLDPNFTGIGRCISGPDGSFSFRTVLPGPYTGPHSGLYRPAHLHFSVFGPTLASRLVTQCYFPGDPLIPHDNVMAVADPRGVDSLIARFDFEGSERGSTTSALAYRWNVVLRCSMHDKTGLPLPDVWDGAVLSPSQTVGPLYGFALMFEGSEQAVSPSDSNAITIRGRLLRGDGTPVTHPDAMIELWAGDLFARTRTDANGEYCAIVAKPDHVPDADGRPQAPHLNVSVFCNTISKQSQTRVYFPDEAEANERDPLLEIVPPERRHTLIAHEQAGALRFDIRLQGDDETAFFSF